MNEWNSALAEGVSISAAESERRVALAYRRGRWFGWLCYLLGLLTAAVYYGG